MTVKEFVESNLEPCPGAELQFLDLFHAWEAQGGDLPIGEFMCELILLGAEKGYKLKERRVDTARVQRLLETKFNVKPDVKIHKNRVLTMWDGTETELLDGLRALGYKMLMGYVHNLEEKQERKDLDAERS